MSRQRRIVQRRPGGRSARVRAAVIDATLARLDEAGYEALELPDVARRAGVHPTSVYRRWRTKDRLVGEAMLERMTPLSPTPDTGSLRADLARLVVEGSALMRTPAVRALFEVLMTDALDPSAEVAAARDGFWRAHVVEGRQIVARAVARGELAADVDPGELIDLLIGPALVRGLLRGHPVTSAEADQIAQRVVAAFTVR